MMGYVKYDAFFLDSAVFSNSSLNVNFELWISADSYYLTSSIMVFNYYINCVHQRGIY